MGFPSKKQLDKVRARLEKAEGTLMIRPDATPLETFRWDICQQFIKYLMRHDLTQDQLAKTLGIDKAKMSKILHHRIDEFSTDRLLRLYQELNPKVKIRLG